MNISVHDKSFRNLFKSKNIPHAIIIESANDVYKYVLETIKVLFCGKEHCEGCRACMKVLNQIHPDLKAIVPLNGSKSIKIEQIRELRQDAYIIPNEADYKVYIINPAELLTVEAQNAFIKILEEPPNNVIFILLVRSTDSLLQTILSRCEIFKISNDKALDCNLDVEKFSKEIVDLSISGKKLEVFKLISSLSSSDRMYIREVVLCIIRCLVDVVREDKQSQIVSTITPKIDRLTDILNYLDKNVNLNLLINYLSEVM